MLGSLPTPIRIFSLAARLSQVCKRFQNGDEEPPVPNTLALSKCADLIHAVVPIASAHERQSMGTQLIAVLQRSNTVFVDGTSLLTHRGQVEIFLLIFGK